MANVKNNMTMSISGQDIVLGRPVLDSNNAGFVFIIHKSTGDMLGELEYERKVRTETLPDPHPSPYDFTRDPVVMRRTLYVFRIDGNLLHRDLEALAGRTWTAVGFTRVGHGALAPEDANPFKRGLAEGLEAIRSHRDTEGGI